MREIKFRDKRKDNGQWVYGFYGYKAETRQAFIMVETVNANCSSYFTEYEVIPESVGEYTGLKDKNGKEIYEGDIYHMGDKNIRYVVVWNDTGLIGKQCGSSSYAGISYWQDKIEVVGNIHENPELLEATK